MKQFALCIFAVAAIVFTTNAQTAPYVQKEFMIGADIAPFPVTESATPAPGDYDGDGKTDLATRVNTGPNAGKFQIDYAAHATPFFFSRGLGLSVNFNDIRYNG